MLTINPNYNRKTPSSFGRQSIDASVRDVPIRWAVTIASVNTPKPMSHYRGSSGCRDCALVARAFYGQHQSHNQNKTGMASRGCGVSRFGFGFDYFAASAPKEEEERSDGLLSSFAFALLFAFASARTHADPPESRYLASALNIIICTLF
jgi:hypothetical protein